MYHGDVRSFEEEEAGVYELLAETGMVSAVLSDVVRMREKKTGLRHNK